MWTLAHKYGHLTPDIVAKELLKLLEEFQPFIHAKSKSHSSVYIHFRALPNGLTHKLRVSTHAERERYGYKWQLRLDGIPRQRKYRRRYFDNVADLVKDFIQYYTRVEELNHDLMQERLQEDFEGHDTISSRATSQPDIV